MAFEDYQDQQPTTGARGPGSPFGANQIVNVPGIGPVKLSDYGPKVRGIDIPVTNQAQMRSNAVNRVVNINGQNVRLSGYMPSNYDPKNVDPTGGGPKDAFGRPIVPFDPQTQSSGTVTDNPFVGGSQSPFQTASPGDVTDNPFAAGYPISVPDNVQQIQPLDIPFSGPLGNELPVLRMILLPEKISLLTPDLHTQPIRNSINQPLRQIFLPVKE